MEKILHNLQDTKKIANELAKSLKVGDIVAFSGDLGAGKTTFIQYLAKALGVKDYITSPTFAIQKIYDVAVGKFIHFDCYRLENEASIETSGLFEALDNKNAIVAIEWAEKVKKYLPKKTIWITLEHIDEKSRKDKDQIMTKSLYLDTTTRKIIIKFYFDDAKKDELIFEDCKLSDAPIIENIDILLKKNDLDIKKLDQLLVNTGPGYFTSTRLGVSFANALKLVNPKLKLLEIRGELDDKLIINYLTENQDKNILSPLYDSQPNITNQKKAQ